MTAIAKVFFTGNSQAVRLPKAFRVTASEMWISRNDLTGEIVLKPRSDTASLDRLFRMIEDAPLPDDFLVEATRRNAPPQPATIGAAKTRKPGRSRR